MVVLWGWAFFLVGSFLAICPCLGKIIQGTRFAVRKGIYRGPNSSTIGFRAKNPRSEVSSAIEQMLHTSKGSGVRIFNPLKAIGQPGLGENHGVQGKACFAGLGQRQQDSILGRGKISLGPLLSAGIG